MLTVAGTVPFTTIDFPGCLAAVIFFKGCPLRCPFCHNPDLQEVGAGLSTWEEVLAFLSTRTKRLDGVVLSGGEPLMQPHIETAVLDIKKMGFQVAVHTSGVYPKTLEKILPLIDWVGLDVKAPWDKYDLLSGRKNMADLVKESIRLLIESGISFEIRTTCDPRYLDKSDIERLTDDLKILNVPTYVLQKYRTFDEDKDPPSDSAINAFFNDALWLDSIRAKFPTFLTR